MGFTACRQPVRCGCCPQWQLSARPDRRTFVLSAGSPAVRFGRTARIDPLESLINGFPQLECRHWKRLALYRCWSRRSRRCRLSIGMIIIVGSIGLYCLQAACTVRMLSTMAAFSSSRPENFCSFRRKCSSSIRQNCPYQSP